MAIYRSLRATALWKKWGMCVLGFLFALRLGVPEDRHVNPELTASSIWFSFYQRFLWLNLSWTEWATNLNHKTHSFLALPLVLCIVLGKSLLLWACFLFSNIGIMTSAISVILRIDPVQRHLQLCPQSSLEGAGHLPRGGSEWVGERWLEACACWGRRVSFLFESLF